MFETSRRRFLSALSGIPFFGTVAKAPNNIVQPKPQCPPPNYYYVPLNQLVVKPERPEQPSPELVKSIRLYGQLNAALAVREGKQLKLIAGFQRYAALKKLKHSVILVKVVDHA